MDFQKYPLFWRRQGAFTGRESGVSARAQTGHSDITSRATPAATEAFDCLMNRLVGVLLLAATAALVVAQAHIP